MFQKCPKQDRRRLLSTKLLRHCSKSQSYLSVQFISHLHYENQKEFCCFRHLQSGEKRSNTIIPPFWQKTFFLPFLFSIQLAEKSKRELIKMVDGNFEKLTSGISCKSDKASTIVNYNSRVII